MRLTSFVVWKSWASNPLRTALTVLGIALGVAIVVAIYVMDHNTIQSRMMQQRLDRGPVDLEVRPIQSAERDVAAIVGDLTARERVRDVVAWVEGTAALTRNGELIGGAQVFGLSPVPGERFGHYRVIAGADLSADDQVLLGEELAKTTGLGPGDRVTVREPERRRRVICKNGVPVVEERPRDQEPFAAEVTVAGVLAYEGIGRRNFGQVMVCALPLVQQGLQPGADPLFHLWREYGADLDLLRRELQGEYLVLDRRSGMIGEAADERAFRNGVKVLGCLALVLGMFVVFQTLSYSLVERLRALGLLRCLGVSRRGLMAVFLWDAFLLGVLGSSLGVGGGIALSAWLRAGHVSTLGLDKPWLTFELPPAPILWTVALGILFTLAGAAFPLWKARNLSPLRVLQARGLDPKREGGDVLRGVNLFLFVMLVGVLPLAYLAMTPLVSEEGRETRTVLLQMGGMVLVFGAVLLIAPQVVTWIGGLMLLPLRLVAPLGSFLVTKTMQRNPGRIAAAVCGLSVVLLALLSLKSLTAALNGEVDQFAAVALQDRLFLETEPMAPGTADVLAAIDGVERVECLEGRVQKGFLLGGLEVSVLGQKDGALENLPERLRQYADTDRRSMVVSRRLAEMKGWEANSLVAVPTDSGPVAYMVLAVSDAAGYVPSERAWAVTSPHWMRQDFCIPERSVQHLMLRLRPAANVEVVQGRVRQVLPVAVQKARAGYWIADYHKRDVARDFQLFDMLLFLIFCLSVVGLVNGMAIAALGRIREIGVLRALGMGRRALVGSFLLEGSIVAALACVLALGLSVPLGQVVVAGLNTVAGLSAPYVVPWGWMMAVPLIAAAVAILSAVVPGVRAARQSPAESVRYE